MLSPVKIMRADDFHKIKPGIIVQHETTQHRLFRFDGMRGHFQIDGLPFGRVLGHRSDGWFG